MTKREWRGWEEDPGASTSRLVLTPERPPKPRVYDRKSEREQSRSGSEAGSADHSRRENDETTSPRRADRSNNWRKTSEEGADEKRGDRQSPAKPGSKKTDKTPLSPKMKRQLEKGGDRQKSINSYHNARGAASPAADGTPDPRQEDKKASVSGSPAKSAGKVTDGAKKDPALKKGPSLGKSKPTGLDSRKKSSPSESPPKKSKRSSPATPEVERDEDEAGGNQQPQLIGGWLNILRGAPSAPLEEHPGGEDGDAGNHTGSKAERKRQAAQEARGQQHSGSLSSCEHPYDTPLSVHTRDLESETLVQEDGGSDVEEAEGWWWWCTCSNVWLGGIVFSIVVVLPLVFILMGYKGRISPHAGPDSNASEESNPWDAVTPRKPREPTIAPEAAYDPSELDPPPQDCDTYPDTLNEATLPKPPVRQWKASTTLKPVNRRVFCVVNVKYTFQRQYSKGFEYSISSIPSRYCAALVYYAKTVDMSGNIRYKEEGKHIDEALTALSQAASDPFRKRTIPIYLTIGGSRKDSRPILNTLKDASPFGEFIRSLRGSSNFQGINLDWNWPGDICTGYSGRTPDYIKAFTDAVKNEKFGVMLTVPPLLSYLDKYGLPKVLPDLDYVIVTTHKLRRPGVVACAGERSLAAKAFRKIRDSFASADREIRRKFAYSISIGADIFKLEHTAEVKHLAPIKRLSAVFNGREIMLGKTSYPDVCELLVVDRNSDEECRVVAGSRTQSKQNGLEQEVAALAGPEELQRRISSSYEEGMGDAPVAVFDVFLDDDPQRRCTETNMEAPLLQTIAETGPS